MVSKKSSDWEQFYYFNRFKMLLYGKMTFDRKRELKDETQKSLPAMTVFSLAIRYLKEDVLQYIKGSLLSCHIYDNEITWVLTVPAIWNDASKQFMREAAVKAEIMDENLIIALEPESASIFCQLLRLEKTTAGNEVSTFKPDSKYMVIDAGGGTVDITVHQIMTGGRLKEIHKASGGDWGGIQVDEAFKELIISLVGPKVFSRFQTETKDDYLELLRAFEVKKRNINPHNDKLVTFHLPASLATFYKDETDKELCKAITETCSKDQVYLEKGKLRISSSVMKKLFYKAIDNTIRHVKMLMNDSKVQDICSILMVGGFSESTMLQAAMKSNFDNVKFIVPEEAGLVVLKGAVIFGHNPCTVAQRVCRFTYGVDSTATFDNSIHDVSKLENTDAGTLCVDLFIKFVESGQTIELDETTKEMSFNPVFENQSSVNFLLYASTEKSPMYVTDESCVNLGTLEFADIDMSEPLEERIIMVSLKFGGTEIEIKAREKKTEKTVKASTNFLG